MASPVAALTHPKGAKDKRKRMLMLAVLAGVVLIWVRRQQSAASPTGIIASADPLSSPGSGDLGGGGGDAGGVDPSVAAALEGLAAGLTDTQTGLANEAANQQSLADALAQMQQELNDFFSQPSYYDPYAGADPYAAAAASSYYDDNSVIDEHNRRAAAWNASRPATKPRTTTAAKSLLPKISLPSISSKVTVRRQPVTMTPARAQAIVHSVTPQSLTPARAQAVVHSVTPTSLTPARAQSVIRSVGSVLPRRL